MTTLASFVHLDVRRRRVVLAAALLVVASALRVAAQVPGMSRGVSADPFPYDECMRRAEYALRAEGYEVRQRGGGYTWGAKGIHGAYILCDGLPSSPGTSIINIVVASNASSADVPGAERVRLGRRIGEVGRTTPPAACTSLVGTWTIYGWVHTFKDDNTWELTGRNPPDSGPWRTVNAAGRVHEYVSRMNGRTYTITVSEDGQRVTVNDPQGPPFAGTRAGPCRR